MNNEVAWKKLFEQHRILEQVSLRGRFEISSVEINKVRQSRLMAKFDQSDSLPTIFRANKLSILPISRRRYVIGPFDTHRKVTYDFNLDPVYFPMPEGLQSLDPVNLYSEAVAINCAFISGMIDDVIGESTYLTVNGRTTTQMFDLLVNDRRDGPAHLLTVDRAQCEIDGGFEGPNSFVLLEAKNLTLDDFLIRQLYYPYRLWRSKLTKPVIPVLMTYSNDLFDFFVYEFVDDMNYNSLQLRKHKRYSALPLDITRADVQSLLTEVKRVPEPMDIPFPQANTFRRVVDLLGVLERIPKLTKSMVMTEYGFVARQVNYHTDASRYLGLSEKARDPVKKETVYSLTDDGRKVMRQRPRERYLSIIRRILEHGVFYDALYLSFTVGGIPSEDAIVAIMRQHNISLNGQTEPRRASTVRAWIAWIWERISD